MLTVVSDLHLDDSREARLFRDEDHGRAFAKLCDAAEGELVLLGDVFELTGMNPPPRGLSAFFERLDVDPPDVRRRTPAELLQAAADNNPQAVEALARASRRIPVTVVPGNHDWQLDADCLRSVGIEARVERSVMRSLDGTSVVLQHGHEQDHANRKPGGAGEALTQVLHQAVIPFLLLHGAKKGIRMDVARVVALRPEEAVISVMQRWLDEKTFDRFFHAFLRLIGENAYLPRGAVWITRFVSPNRLRALVHAQDFLWEKTGFHATESLKGKEKLAHGAPRPDVLVFGHTHVPDWAPLDNGRLYVNLGTWTDRAFDAHSPKDTSLPWLSLDGRTASLHDAARGIELQRWVR